MRGGHSCPVESGLSLTREAETLTCFDLGEALGGLWGGGARGGQDLVLRPARHTRLSHAIRILLRIPRGH